MINEPIEPVDATGIAQPAAALSLGRTLAAAREQAGMTCEEAAAQLRLSVRQVQGLENDDVSVLPGPTFVRGFIRNYAKLLQLDVEPLLAAYAAHTPNAGQSEISLTSTNIPLASRAQKTWQPYALAVVVLVFALIGWKVYMDNFSMTRVSVPAAATPAASVATEPSVAEVVTAVPAPAPAELPPQVAEPATAAMPTPTGTALPVAAAAPDPATPAQPAEAAPAIKLAKLKLTFLGRSWVGVTDRDGKEIFNRNESAGGIAIVEGTPPFSVVVGNAAAVQLTFNEQPVDLAAHTKVNVARLTLE